jgi:hypothetical protein
VTSDNSSSLSNIAAEIAQISDIDSYDIFDIIIHPDAHSPNTRRSIPTNSITTGHPNLLNCRPHPTPSRRAHARSISRAKSKRSYREGEARCAFSTDLCLLRATQFGEYSRHALSLCISDGPKTITRIRTDNKTGHVSGDKA